MSESRTLTLEELDDLVSDVLLVEAWASAIRGRIQAALENGIEFDNARLVPKRATRKWSPKDQEGEVIPSDKVDEFVRAKLLELFTRLGKVSTLDVVAPRETISVAVAEKVMGKKWFSELMADNVKAESSGFNLSLG